VPEREMTKDHAYVEEVLRAWASPFGDYPTPEDVERYGNAMAMPFVAHSAAEHYRWFGRSQLRQDGPLFNRRIRGPVTQPVLQLQGTEDGCVLADCTRGSADYVSGPYAFQLVDGAGHFLTEEAPDRVSSAIVDWLDTVD
jgi:pimeloyl-ACP methyl ester carboxylesterase